MELVKNLGRREVNSAAIYQKDIPIMEFYQILIYRENLEKMLNIIMILAEKKVKSFMIFLDKKHRHSCAYWKNDTQSLEAAQQNKINTLLRN